MSSFTELAPARHRAFLTAFIDALVADEAIDTNRIEFHRRRLELQVDREAMAAVEGGRRHG